MLNVLKFMNQFPLHTRFILHLRATGDERRESRKAKRSRFDSRFEKCWFMQNPIFELMCVFQS